MTYEPITDQEIKTNIAYFSDLRDKLVLGYREGCCGFRETMDRLRSRVIYDGLFYFLERHGIGLCITDFPKFARDYHAWKAGAPAFSGNSGWNLQPVTSIWPEKPKESPDLTSAEAEHLFQLIDGIGLPLDYLRPADPYPEDMAVPVWVDDHAYADGKKISVKFFCVDDGGIFSDEAPYGKTFTLTDKNGVHAVLKIETPPAFPPDIDHSDMPRSVSRDYLTFKMSRFVATGYLEGYTFSDFNRRICMYVYDNPDILRFSTFMKHEEYNEVYNIFPLWQDYLHKQNDDRAIREKVLEEWILRLAGDLPCDTQE